jgi:hypothetical protein
MVDERTCTCGEPGGGCVGALCTAAGWVCPDAGADADASPDTPVKTETCGGEPNPYCFQAVGHVGDIVVCGDSGWAATCVSGHWTCAPGQVESRLCTCTEFHPPGCGICTLHGWACTDGGTDGVATWSLPSDGPRDDGGDL